MIRVTTQKKTVMKTVVNPAMNTAESSYGFCVIKSTFADQDFYGQMDRLKNADKNMVIKTFC